ncbi:MAG: pitrilysin family protein [Bacilli bacterium]
MKMNKNELLDLTIYSKTLSNGLEIYIVPKKDSKTTYATFTTNYGSNIIEFVPKNQDNFIKVPSGIAHFLEHKMFEQEDGTDPFTFFSNNGCDANANTTYYKTTYLFSGANKVEENLEFLIDYVQAPYFTDENVEKEKGIITQEIRMYLDDPISRLYEQSIANSFSKHPIRIPVIGDEKNINSITKENLYDCYNTFYQPSNMVLVVTGNVDPDKIIKLVEENQKKKDYSEKSEIKIKTYDEPDKVNKKNEVLKMNVNIPKISVNYKINYQRIKKYSKREILNYLNLFFYIKFDNVSDFTSQMKNEEFITDPFGLIYVDTDKHILYMIMNDSNKPQLLIDNIKDTMQKFDITPEMFERKKKVLKSGQIYMSDNIFGINHKIISSHIKYGEVFNDDIDFIDGLTFKDFKDCIKQMKFNEASSVTIDSKDKN